jgi:thiol-disulfide isomerase/thioredoxin
VKKLILSGLCLGLSTLLACNNSASKVAPFVAQDLHQEVIEFPNVKQWLVINYWASWCQPCRQEIPELNALSQNNAQVRVVGINSDGLALEPLTAQANELGIEYQVLTSDPRAKLGISKLAGIPATFLVSPKGYLHGPLLGAQTQATLQAKIDTLN